MKYLLSNSIILEVSKQKLTMFLLKNEQNKSNNS